MTNKREQTPYRLPKCKVHDPLDNNFGEKALLIQSFIEPKVDGIRLAIVVEDAQLELGYVQTQTGKIYPHLSFLTIEASILLRQLGLNGGVFDGEGISTEDPTWNGAAHVVGAAALNNRALLVEVFDFIPLDEFKAGFGSTTTLDRKRLLNQVFNSVEENLKYLSKLPSKRLVVGNIEAYKQAVTEAYQNAISLGYEGLVVKDATSLYDSRSRTKSGYRKLKPFDNTDVIVVGYEEGQGKYSGMLGSFLCADEENQLISVGGGFTDKQRLEFWDNRGQMIGRYLEVKKQANVPNISARHCTFVRLRLEGDK